MRNHIILFRNGYRNSQIDEKREKNINDKNNHSLINYNGQYRKIIKPNNIRRGIKDKGRVEKLEKYLNMEVILQDERLSTVEANNYMLQADISRKKRKQKKDSLAANIILQAYLDRRKGE